jgi:hypothetical protein
MKPKETDIDRAEDIIDGYAARQASLAGPPVS